MTTDEILSLVKAGYSAADIAAMEAPSALTPEPIPEDPVPEPSPVAGDPPESVQPDVMTREEVTALFGSLQSSIAELTKAVQAANAKAARSPDPGAGKLSVENVVADFFGGPSGKKGG